MSEQETKKRVRDAAVYIVTMNGEEHYISAKSQSAALKFAVNETVSVRKAALKDLSRIAEATAKGNEIHHAA